MTGSPDHDHRNNGQPALPLWGRIAIVTGGAGGMGRAHALRLARLGADVAIFDRDLNVARQYGETLQASSVVEELQMLGRRAMGIEADLSDPGQAAAAISEVVRAWGAIDILVNNAGGAITPIERSTATLSPAEDVEILITSNLRTTFNCCRAAAPHMRTGGAIVNIGSAGIDLDNRLGQLAVYSAMKAAITRYTRSLAVELGPRGIRANCVAPGIIETARIKAQSNSRGIGTPSQAAKVPLGRLGVPEDVATVVAFLVSDEAGYVTGECLRVTGGMTLLS